MKVKVLKRFKDKYTKKIHDAGEVFECTEERYKEITSKGTLVEKITEKKATRATKKSQAAETEE